MPTLQMLLHIPKLISFEINMTDSDVNIQIARHQNKLAMFEEMLTMLNAVLRFWTIDDTLRLTLTMKRGNVN